MDIKKMPVIGKVTTKELKYTLTDFPSGGLTEHTMPAESYSVVHIFEDDGQKTYVTNEWYKEYKKVPLLIIESLVDTYEPTGEDVQYNNGGAVKFYNKELQHRLARPSGSIEKELLDKVRYDSIKEDFVGNFGWKTPQGNLGDGYLFKLDDFDQDLMKNISLKPAERIFRYINRTSAIGGMTPLIKMNLEKGLLYFPIYNDNDDILFETRGVKALWISLIEDKYVDGGEVQFIEYKDSEIMFEPYYKEYFVGDEQFSSLEDAQKYIDEGSQLSQRTINAYRHGAMKDGGGVGSDKWQIKNEADKYYSIDMRTFQPAWNESPDLGYSFVKGEAESIKNKLTELGFAGLSVVEYNPNWWKAENGMMTNGGTISDSIDLFFQEGGSDKEYHIQLVGLGDGTYVVNFQFGRRGSKLNSGTKTATPVPLDKAQKIYDSLKREKMNKGYEPDFNAISTAAATQVKPQSKTVHILPQLLNPVEEYDMYIDDDTFLAQEKKDYERRIIISDGKGGIMGLNKKGQEVPVPKKIAQSITDECILDGEISADKYYVFDIISFEGKDLKHFSTTQRLEYLYAMDFGLSVEKVETAYTAGEKALMYEVLKAENREGIVFKKKGAPYTPGRPNSGGSQLKYKFYKTATFIVANMTKDKRSVGLELIDDNTGARVPMGKVTIPPNFDVPDVGDLVEVRYLYAYKGGSAYQPVYLGKRNDSDLTDATMKQIVFKAEDEFKDGGSIFTNDGHGNYTNQLGYQLIDQFDGTYQVLDPNGMDISGEYETYQQGKETINEHMTFSV